MTSTPVNRQIGSGAPNLAKILARLSVLTVAMVIQGVNRGEIDVPYIQTRFFGCLVRRPLRAIGP